MAPIKRLEAECPRCGLKGGLELFCMAVEAKKCIMIAAMLPREVAPLAAHYMALFAPLSGHGVALLKGARLLAELRDLVAKGYVQHSKLVARTCPPHIWAAAIQTMLDNRPGLKLPMPNHRYLIKVAYDQADQLDRDLEQAVRTAEQSHQRPNDHEQLGGPVRIASINPLAHLMED